MKKNVKKLLMVCAVGAVSAFALLGASCNNSVGDWFEQKIEQIKCEHVTTKEIPMVAPTCTEKGSTTGKECVDCGKVTVKPDTIAALGHELVHYDKVEPTCLENGKTEGEYCTVCDTWVKEQKVIKATGHDVELVKGKSPTCTETGLTDGQRCENCGEWFIEQKVISALGHTYEDGECKGCSAVELSRFLNGTPDGLEEISLAEATGNCYLKFEEKEGEAYHYIFLRILDCEIFVNGERYDYGGGSLGGTVEVGNGGKSLLFSYGQSIGNGLILGEECSVLLEFIEFTDDSGFVVYIPQSFDIVNERTLSDGTTQAITVHVKSFLVESGTYAATAYKKV